MDLKQCIIFREVSKTENFTQAANNLYITQSAVSHSMKKLEEEAETKLFERLHKSVKLTKTGEIFLEEILPILESVERLESRMKILEQDTPLHIACCITFSQKKLPELIKKFNILYPNTKVIVKIQKAESSLELLRQGKVDLAFIEGNILVDNFEVRQISSYKLIAISSNDYYRKGKISIEELIKKDLLLREKGSSVRDEFDAALSLKGYRVNPVWESVNTDSLVEGVKNDLGISILPKILLSNELEKGHIKEIEIEDFEIFNNISLVLNKNKYKTDSLNKFLELVDLDR
ncbi:LysR family transcriptional regulator [Miniphocaeibacter halophilus]|uniref:LysR family transcriptional regulator n=1 Tax=Miniphocaeibacter halophilus TaxID=2931922 RepID=A0AC61MZL7_9FIRM|nr:LysR family transcriptional regulator [Miniphocaeibacter halophilus]QQK08584.1 LysR family transcriptional regulator [Miniphocaeibacter halophilus]